MSLPCLRWAVLFTAALLAASLGIASERAAASVHAEGTETFAGAFRGSIRNGPLADLSLTGLLSMSADTRTHRLSGVLVDQSGSNHLAVLARVSGRVTKRGATLRFRTTRGGHVIRGTSTKPVSAGQILKGGLRLRGGHGDWIAVPLVLENASLTPQRPTLTPWPIQCLLDAPCIVLPDPPGGPVGGSGPGGTPPDGLPDGGVTGGNGDTYCANLREQLGAQADTEYGRQLLELLACPASEDSFFPPRP
jgi:hypothetical protein